ncbi:hypothetical protein ACFLTP_03540 [Chloroflexota bacterium]
MRNRKRSGISKIGILALALILVMGIMGVAYSGWTDVISIDGLVETGTSDLFLQVDDDGWGPPDPDNPPDPLYDDQIGEPGIACSVDNPTLTVTIALSNIQPDIDYYCNFHIENNGTLPVKIQSISFNHPVLPDLPGPWPAGFVPEITGVAKGDQIEPLGVANGSHCHN